MTDRPILFSGPMVRAILEGRKTQTRRVIKNYGRLPDYCGPRGCEDDPGCWGWEYDGYWVTLAKESDQPLGYFDLAATYQIGDRLWVRETWSHTGAGVWTTTDVHRAMDGKAIYRADGDKPGVGWFPSIFMFLKLSRITLIVTDVRVQRLQDLSEWDARQEGVDFRCRNCGYTFEDAAIHMDHNLCGEEMPKPQGVFSDLWDSLNKKRGFGWETNPWVVAITFEPVFQNIDSIAQEAAQ